MQQDDELILEEAQRRSRELVDKMIADGHKQDDDLEHSALVMFLVAERGLARRRNISAPEERKAVVAAELTRISQRSKQC